MQIWTSTLNFLICTSSRSETQKVWPPAASGFSISKAGHILLLLLWNESSGFPSHVIQHRWTNPPAGLSHSDSQEQ